LRHPNGTISNRTRLYIAYADDVLILGQSVTAMEEVVTQIKELELSTGLATTES
jgi:hypothetical protein